MNQVEFHQKTATFSEVNTYEKIKRLFAFESHKHLKILDVGCGNGLLDNFLARQGQQVVGLDVHNPSQEVSGWQFLPADINQPWPVAEGSFDLVICTDVVEHLYSPGHVLQQSKRVLKPDGKLIFGAPNHFDLKQRLRTLFGKGIVHWDNLAYNESSWDYGHIRFFTLGELKQKFEKSGWRIDTAQFNFMGGGLLPTLLLPKIIKRWLLMNLPTLFSGKFIFLLSPQTSAGVTKNIYIPYTPLGL